MTAPDDRRPHRHRLRVRYCETDQMGVAHHGSYVDWFEEARTEWLRARGQSYADWERDGLLLQVVEDGVRYLQPTRYDEVLEITTHLDQRRSASLTLRYEVRRPGDDAVLAVGTTKLAAVDRDGAVRRLPADF